MIHYDRGLERSFKPIGFKRRQVQKGGMYLVGGNKFAEFGKYRAAPLAIQATQDGRGQEYP